MRKAEATTTGTFARIEARSSLVNVEESIKKMQLNVQASAGDIAVESRTYVLESVTEPSPPPMNLTNWGLAATGQSCQAYCSSLTKSFDAAAMETRVLKNSDPNSACNALIIELGIPAMGTGAFPNESSAGCTYAPSDDVTAVANVSAPNDGNLSLSLDVSKPVLAARMRKSNFDEKKAASWSLFFDA